MKELYVIGISRGSRYSPHRTESDAAIFAKVTKELEKKGWIIDLFSDCLLYTSDAADEL